MTDKKKDDIDFNFDFDSPMADGGTVLYEMADTFLMALKDASEYNMEQPFVAFVLEALFRGESLADAIWYAQCEWDL